MPNPLPTPTRHRSFAKGSAEPYEPRFSTSSPLSISRTICWNGVSCSGSGFLSAAGGGCSNFAVASKDLIRDSRSIPHKSRSTRSRVSAHVRPSICVAMRAYGLSPKPQTSPRDRISTFHRQLLLTFQGLSYLGYQQQTPIPLRLQWQAATGSPRTWSWNARSIS